MPRGGLGLAGVAEDLGDERGFGFGVAEPVVAVLDGEPVFQFCIFVSGIGVCP
nr:hypothetical protein [Conexibacter sp. S30A1]